MSISQARRLALRSQGFTTAKKLAGVSAGSGVGQRNVGWRNVKQNISQMGVVQIDAINTVIRSHYMPMYSRLGAYNRSILDKRVFDSSYQSKSRRSTFEYWAHECSIVPIDLYPLFRWRMKDAKRGVGIYKQLQNLAVSNPSLIRRVKSRISADGPLTCADISEGKRGKGMWEWGVGKQALEYLFCTGELSSHGRRGFQRLYADRKNSIPSEILNAPLMPRIDAQKKLVLVAAKALGVSTASDLRDYFRLSARDFKPCLEELVEDKQLQAVCVEGWEKTAFMTADVTIPRKVNISTLLSPFDPVVWCRERASRLFDFDYRTEIYVPAEKRKYGYYVLPYLLDDRLEARLDIKADRETGILKVFGAWAENVNESTRTCEQLSKELFRLAAWLDLSDVKIGSKGNLSKPLRAGVAGGVVS